MREFLFYLYAIIFIPTWVLLAIGIVNIFRAEQHKTEKGKREYFATNRILTGEGYNFEGIKHHKVSIRYIKRAGFGMAFLLLTLLSIAYVGK